MHYRLQAIRAKLGPPELTKTPEEKKMLTQVEINKARAQALLLQMQVILSKQAK